MDETPVADTQKSPNLFLHALIVPGTWLALGVLVELTSPGFRLGITGTAGFFVLLSVGICWLILRRYGRMPTNNESWRLVIYCSVLAVLVESWVLFIAVTSPELFPDVSITPNAAWIVILFSAVLDTLFFMLGFKVAAPNFLKTAIGKSAAVDEEAG